jgi:chemotaxis protein methyltransferase CheR
MGESRTYNEGIKALSNRDFDRLSQFISEHCGIKMPPAKKTLLESRLQKRLRTLRTQSFREYCDYLFEDPDGICEIVHMIDAVTTNKTDFFREPAHYSFLSETVLSEFDHHQRAMGAQRFAVWSAGCSSGEEPYTLAIVLSEFAERNPGFQFTIMATDISTKVLDKARNGIYDESQIAMIPYALKQKYFTRSKDRDKKLVRVAPALRSSVRFQRLNLMDQLFPAPGASLDAVFCRNVMIYFERDTQSKLLGRFCRCLKRGGYLFLGHSEMAHGFDLPLIRIASAIYRKMP